MKVFSALLKFIARHPAIAYQMRLASGGLPWDASYPRGHFYSTLPDIEEVKRRKQQIYHSKIELQDGVDLNVSQQKEFVEILIAYSKEFPFPKQKLEQYRFYLDNVSMSGMDALALFAMLKHLSPQRVIEVGCGFSSALMLDTNTTDFDSKMDLTFIDPYAERFKKLLRPEELKTVSLIEQPVQDVSLDTFERLEANDILFIDSSHVAKTGSDVNFLFFDVLPRLCSGVVVHLHDIYWPFEYPVEWVLQGQAWNEDYLLRSFLQYNNAFEVLLFNNYVGQRFSETLLTGLPEKLRLATPTEPPSERGSFGSSFWMRKR